MNDQLLDAVPLWAILFIAAAILGLTLEAGFRLGLRRKRRVPEEREQAVGPIVASILGLVALVLGFTFGLVAGRSDARRMGVLSEANAINTAYRRASLLKEPQRSESAELLGKYLEVRIKGTEGTLPIEQALAESEALHDSLWQEVAESSEVGAPPAMLGLYVASLNQVIEMHATRLLAGRSRLPLGMLVSLLGLAALGMGSMGYQSAITAMRRSPAMIALVLAFATVLYLIADLDRSQDVLLRTGQQPMTDLMKLVQVQGADGNSY